MNKNFRSYAIIWAILFAAWCAVLFLVRPVIPGFSVVYGARFWTAFGFTAATFVGNLVCAYIAFKAENLKKTFYNLPLITISWGALITMIVVSAILLLIPDLPAWIAAVVCLVIFAFNAIAVVKAVWAADTVVRVDEKIKAQTSFVKLLTVDAEGLVARAKSEAVKAECVKVYEAVRYSDPMSSDALAAVEADISAGVRALGEAVAADDAEKVKELAQAALLLIGERNAKCKALK